jgi:hypothetical protein
MLWVLLLLMGAYPTVAGQGSPAGPQVTFRTQSILPPAALYVTPNDSIEVQARSPSVTTTMALTVRILTPQGIVTEYQQSLTVATVGTGIFTQDLSPTEGFILSAQLTANAASRGQCFVKLQLHKNPSGSDQTLGALLFQGYVSADDHLSYPQSVTESSLNGRGWLHGVTVSNPAAGANITTSVPTGVHWNIRSLAFQFVSGAGAGNRTVVLEATLTTGQSGLFVVPTSVQTAGLTYLYGYAQGIFNEFQTPYMAIALPTDAVLPAGTTITAGLGGIQSADQFQNISMFVEEWVSQ